ncbi:7294_t:CDS:1, partial [Racocetra persica]
MTQQLQMNSDSSTTYNQQPQALSGLALPTTKAFQQEIKRCDK